MADVVGEGGGVGRMTADLEMTSLIDKIFALGIDVQMSDSLVARLAGPFGCCLRSWVFLFLFCLLVIASMCSCVGNPTAPNLVASAPIN